MAAARAAQDYGLPLLVMARSKDPVTVGDHIFRISILQRQQIIALFNYAIDDRGFKSFAAMIPNDADGITAYLPQKKQKSVAQNSGAISLL